MKKVALLVLSTVLLISLAACGMKSETPATTPVETKAETPAETATKAQLTTMETLLFTAHILLSSSTNSQRI